MQTIIFKANNMASIGDGTALPVQTQRSGDSFDLTLNFENATVASVVKALTADKSIYITDIVISAQHAGNILLQDTDETLVYGPIYMAANGFYPHKFATPIEVTESKDLMVKASAAIHFTLTVAGYVI